MRRMTRKEGVAHAAEECPEHSSHSKYYTNSNTGLLLASPLHTIQQPAEGSLCLSILVPRR